MESTTQLCYESPYCYHERAIRLDTSHAACSRQQAEQYMQDGTLSKLDMEILRILFQLEYADRNQIERELEPYSGRKPKNLKRTMNHLIEDGIVRAYYNTERDTLWFYSLTPEVRSLLKLLGYSSELSLDGVDMNILEICRALAYHQFYRSFCAGATVISHERNYMVNGSHGEVISDGYIVLGGKTGKPERIFVHVARRNYGNISDAISWYRAMGSYIQGGSRSVTLFLCESDTHALELARNMEDLPETLQRYYLFDTLCGGSESVAKRILHYEENAMHYGTIY